MENKEINIAGILKDKPQGTKLYSFLFGECTLDNINKSNGEILVICKLFACIIDKHGHVYKDGECILFPSKEMRDWSKLTWKKGDILTDNTSTICMFDSWANEYYTEFNAKYTLHSIASTNAENEVCKTNDFVPVLKDIDKQSYLVATKSCFNVNLAKYYLKIEKPKPEFKNGDIMFEPFQRVLVRDNEEQKWRANLFSHYNVHSGFKYIVFSGPYKCCIPYNDQTKHLLGTTDDWEGGEG